MTERLVAIVDPYSSGSLFAPEFWKHGFDCVMVQSADTVQPIYRSYRESRNFVRSILHGGSVAATAAQLRKWNTRYVLAGCEAGVMLADSLNEHLGLVSNGTCLSEARRNKFLMAKTVESFGLRVPAQFCSSNLTDILRWVRRLSAWPLVVKPLASTGNDRVQVCKSEPEIEHAYRAIINQPNVLGLLNKEVLVQEYLFGTEYVVDTVSWAGQHRLATIWRYGKPSWDTYPVGYDRMQLLPGEGETQRQLFAYVTRVLDALDIQYGPAHSEVMLTGDGPVLVEVGARMNGGNSPAIAKQCTGTSQLDLTLQAYIDPAGFLSAGRPVAALNMQGILAFLMPRSRRRLNGLRGLDQIKRLRSCRKVAIGTERAAVAPRVIGWVLLIHADSTVVESDLQRIRELEEGDLYDLDEQDGDVSEPNRDEVDAA